ncbi:MAG: hypothetical protein ABUL73_02490 [Alphaproteobacteria bacterium]
MLGFALAVTFAAYLTALVRTALGLVVHTDQPYMGLWADIEGFPLMFAVLHWPTTALVLAATVPLANAINGRLGARRWIWWIAIAFLYTAIGLAIVVVASTDPWGGGGMLFGPYSQGWANPQIPLFKVILLIAFCIGGFAAAPILDFVAGLRRSPS